jgi:hypothetical protein
MSNLQNESNPHGVRRATDSDIEPLYELVPQILAENEVLHLSPGKIQDLVERCCLQRGGAIAGVIDGEYGTIDASIGMSFVTTEVSDEPYISVAWCGMSPAARKLPEELKKDLHHPRRHYGKRLFSFARWAHSGMEVAAGHRIIMRWNVLTLDALTPKMALHQRYVPQIGAYYAFGAEGDFRGQMVLEEIAA